MMHHRFKTAEKAREYERLYDKVMRLWPIGYCGYTLDTSYGKTWIHEIGDRGLPPLVLIHGSYGSSTLWFPNVEHLSKHFRVIAPDVIGQAGKSVLEKPLVAPSDMDQWLDEVARGLGLARFSIGGMSYGGWLAARYALYAPQKVDKLILLDPAGVFAPLKATFYLRMFAAMVIPIPSVGKSFASWLTQGYAMHTDYAKQLATGIEDYKLMKGQKQIYVQALPDADLRKMNMPVLILLGAKSVLFDREKVVKRATAFLPHVKVEIVPDCAHALNMERADTVNERMVDFLTRG